VPSDPNKINAFHKLVLFVIFSILGGYLITFLLVLTQQGLC
jgi:hypothetical protein